MMCIGIGRGTARGAEGRPVLLATGMLAFCPGDGRVKGVR